MKKEHQQKEVLMDNLSHEPQVRLIRIAEIVIGERVRQDMGDLEGLAASINERGLLQPIGLTPDHTLLFGERRLRACRDHLGWREIPAYVITGHDDLAARLAVERDENLHRMNLVPSEQVAMARRLTTALAPEAAERQIATQAQAGEKVGGQAHRARLQGGGTTDHPLRSKTRDQVAKAVGTSPRRLRAAREVVEAESHPDPEVRAVATQMRAEMDRTGEVEPAQRRVRLVRRLPIGTPEGEYNNIPAVPEPPPSAKRVASASEAQCFARIVEWAERFQADVRSQRPDVLAKVRGPSASRHHLGQFLDWVAATIAPLSEE
jgi:ParB family chromosome partitioning protein